MAVATSTAILGAAALGAGASMIASNNAADKAAGYSQQATDQNVALQREILATQQSNTAGARAVGNAALQKLAQQFGLSVDQVASAAQGLGVAVEGGSAPAAAVSPEFLANPLNQDLVAEGNRVVASGEFPDMASYLAYHQSQAPGEYEQRGNWQASAAPTQAPATPVAPATPASQSTTAATDIDSSGFYTGVRPTVGAAPTYVAPTYRETAVAPLDVSLGNYEKSPDYEFQQEEGSKRILATAAATGGLESGAALKALQKYGQNLAMGDYGQWRDYTTGQFNNDRAFTANRDDAANSFGQSTALAKFGADQSNYQYGTNLGQSIFNTNRDYATSRSDYNTGALMGLAGYGQNATNASNGALASAGANIGNAYFNNATTQGNAALSSAGQFNNLLSSGSSALAYYYGNKPAAGGAAPGATSSAATPFNPLQDYY